MKLLDAIAELLVSLILMLGVGWIIMRIIAPQAISVTGAMDVTGGLIVGLIAVIVINELIKGRVRVK